MTVTVGGREYIGLDKAGAIKLYESLYAEAKGESRDLPALVEYAAQWLPPDFMTRNQLISDFMGAAPLMTIEEATETRARCKKAHTRGKKKRLSYLVDENHLRLEEAIRDQVASIKVRDEARRRVAEESQLDDDSASDYADVAALIRDGAAPRVPDAGGVRNDGVRMAYRAAINVLVGNPEAGKTLIAAAQAVDELKAGGSVLHIDADHNGADATIARYLAFGVAADILGDPQRFRFVELRGVEHLRRVVAECTSAWQPSFVIIDSVGEVIPLFGGDSNSNDDYRRIHREGFLPFARAGAAVMLIDHVTKADAATGYATGAGAKKAAVDGVMLAVSAVEPFVPGSGGAAALRILKDRHGGLRASSPSGKNPTAAVFRLDSRGDVSTWEFWKGRGDDERADEQTDADISYVAALAPFPTSVRALQAALRAAHGKGWKNDRAAAALEAARARRDSTTTFPINNESQED